MVQTIFGIRHHGPGSAKRLRKALKALQPDCILVELPGDTVDALAYVANEELRPPVALLVYNPKDLSQSSYLPFAEFSPEWQALRYGVKHGIPVWPADLPLGHLYAHRADLSAAQLMLADAARPEEARMQDDPLGFLAELAGYSDSERWWEVTFEQEESETALFDAILEMVRTLRSGLGRAETSETLLREAHMRQMIRKARQQGYGRIAVVCGAWHAPVLADVDIIKPAADKQRLRGLKKIKTVATWIPWTYDRLARHSGYSAGISSPAWYELLFKQRPEVTIRWMSRVAGFLRREGFQASPAHVLEAVRLAESLAVLRYRSLPGLEELEEAAQAVFWHGEAHLMELIRDRLIIGNAVGRVPPEIPVVPLQQDLEQSIRSARLTKESQTTESIHKDLDLRKESNLQASLLLHRLNLLGIGWGRLRKGSQLKKGSFKEEWTLKWKPDFAIRVIESSPLGNTIYEAATQSLLKRAAAADDLSTLSALVGEALRADLREAVDPLILHLRAKAALTKDIHSMMEALPSLANIVAYGNTRQTDTVAVEQLVDELVSRICIGFSTAAMDLEEETARDLFAAMLSTNRAIGLLNRQKHLEAWEQVLRQLPQRQKIAGIIRGGAVRLLFDRGIMPVSLARDHLYFALSPANPPAGASAWLEGFLHGSGLLILHHPSLWEILDEWVAQLPDALFRETLPVLRRIFAAFPAGERQKMLELVKYGPAKQDDRGSGLFEKERAQEVLPVLRLLLGLDETDI